MSTHSTTHKETVKSRHENEHSTAVCSCTEQSQQHEIDQKKPNTSTLRMALYMTVAQKQGKLIKAFKVKTAVNQGKAEGRPSVA